MPTTLTRDLATFQDRADALVREHRVVTANPYTTWFATGAATVDDVRHLTVQFSVFSHQFLEAQLRRVFNARSLESYRAAKEILLNELGVVFRPGAGRAGEVAGVDPELVATEGTIEGSRFKFAARTSSGCCDSVRRSVSSSPISAGARTARPRRSGSATS